MTAEAPVADTATRLSIPASNLAPAMVALWRSHSNGPHPHADAQAALGAHDALVTMRHGLLFARNARNKRNASLAGLEANYRAALTAFSSEHPLTADAGVVPPVANPNRQQGDPLDLTPGNTTLGYFDWDTYFLLEARNLL